MASATTQRVYRLDEIAWNDDVDPRRHRSEAVAREYSLLIQGGTDLFTRNPPAVAKVDGVLTGIDGRTRATALRMAGRKEIPAVFLGEVTLREAKMLAAESNRVHGQRLSTEETLDLVPRLSADGFPDEEIARRLVLDRNQIVERRRITEAQAAAIAQRVARERAEAAMSALRKRQQEEREEQEKGRALREATRLTVVRDPEGRPYVPAFDPDSRKFVGLTSIDNPKIEEAAGRQEPPSRVVPFITASAPKYWPAEAVRDLIARLRGAPGKPDLETKVLLVELRQVITVILNG